MACFVLINHLHPKPKCSAGNLDEITCPHCSSTDVIRKGVRRDKFRLVQLHCCKRCRRTFSLAPMRKVKYPPRIILDAVSSYNLGCAQKEVAKLMARKHRKVPERPTR